MSTALGSAELVAAASGPRHPLVSAPVMVPTAAADIPGVHHASVAYELDPTRSAGGGAARRPVAAAVAAVAEALERWAAAHATLPLRRTSSGVFEDLPLGSSRKSSKTRRADAGDQQIGLAEWSLHSDAQRQQPGFPYARAYPDDPWLTQVYDLATNQPWWVPAALVSLADDFGALSTSSGLAADMSVITALLRATQELVERDAYVVTWLHQLGGREVPVPQLAAEVAAHGGNVRAFDLTQDFNSHPVALVTGTVSLAGKPRHAVGVACRATWLDAVEKAYLEMLQGTVFVGHQLATHPNLNGLPASAVTGFDEHAIYYSANPDRWDDVPLHRDARPAATPPGGSSLPADPNGADGNPDGEPDSAPNSDASPDAGPPTQLHELVTGLAAGGVRLFYRELTTVDCNQLGLRVVRVLSPDLAPLHHDHRWPFLGGRTPDVTWRYRDAPERGGAREFPSPYPHALG